MPTRQNDSQNCDKAYCLGVLNKEQAKHRVNGISSTGKIENHQSTTLIDNIFVNNTEENYKCGNLFTDLSDHLLVFLKTINLQRFKHHNAKSRFPNDKKINHLCQDLENIDWKNVYSRSDA